MLFMLFFFNFDLPVILFIKRASSRIVHVSSPPTQREHARVVMFSRMQGATHIHTHSHKHTHRTRAREPGVTFCSVSASERSRARASNRTAEKNAD